jgi:hypothetical protein
MWDPREDSYIQELAARIEALEEVADFEEADMLRRKINLIRQVVELGQQPKQPAPVAEDSSATAAPTAIFPVEYADSDGDGIRILMEPAEETGRVCWVVRNSRYVNPCHEFSSPEDAYAAHRRAQPATAPPAPAGGLVNGICRQLPLSPGEVRAVVREVVAWLRSEPWLGRAAADRLEQEANR